MLRDMKELEGYSIQATDGELGEVHSFYFDDERGVVRYLVVDTGGWLSGQQVLISPEALGEPDWVNKKLPVNLTKGQIEDSPSIATDQPVSRQMEVHLRDYYGWDPYWQTAVIHNPWQSMGAAVHSRSDQAHTQQANQVREAQMVAQNPHLRTSEEVIGYHIQALDGEIGHVETFLVDDVDWRIRYLVVDTRNWLPGKKVLVAPEWMEKIVWQENMVYVNLTKETIKSSPEYDDSVPLKRDYEKELYDHYNSTGYWLI